MKTVEERLAELESRVAELEGRPFARSPNRPIAEPPKPFKLPEFNAEGLLGRVGVGLLVVGLVLLFKYAVDQGWLTPVMRIAIGGVIGVGLLAGGFFRFLERRLYRQILMGGGVVVLFVTTIAATQLYHLFSTSGALAVMVAIAAMSFLIAQQQRDQVIATIASLGALVSPLPIFAGQTLSEVYWLYVAIVVAWAGTLSALRGWQTPLILTGLGGVIALLSRVPNDVSKLPAILAVSAAWITCAALPLILEKNFLSKLRYVLPVFMTLTLGFVVDANILRNMHGFSLSAAIDALGFAIIAYQLQRSKLEATSAAIVAASASAAAYIGDPAWPLAIAIGALAAMRLRIEVLSHVLAAVAGLAFLVDWDQIQRRPAFDPYALTFFGIVAIAALMKHRVYLIAAYGGLLALLASELSAVPGAPWLASVSYAILGAILLIGGRVKLSINVQRAGMVALALLIGRLFLFDLVKVDVGVRIVLFMACGFGFLALSYMVSKKSFDANA